MEVVHGSAAIGSHRAWSAWSIISSGTILRPLSSARTLWDLLILILIAYSVVRALAAPRAYNTGYWRRLRRGLPPRHAHAFQPHLVGSGCRWDECAVKGLADATLYGDRPLCRRQ